MERPHFRQRARSRSQEKMGMLSNQAMALPQRGQRLPGETMLCPFGTRAITTLRKLPTTVPTAKTQSANATGMPRAIPDIYEVAALPRARDTNSSSREWRWGVSEMTVAPEEMAAASAERARLSST